MMCCSGSWVPAHMSASPKLGWYRVPLFMGMQARGGASLLYRPSSGNTPPVVSADY